MARATVIIPTYGEARFARWAIRSVQRQTADDLEICVACDGSPPGMLSFFREIAREDPRVRVFAFPKSPRTGEPYRDEIIRRTSGRIVCYCCHDDLWLPGHVEAVEETLGRFDFTHTLHANVRRPDPAGRGRRILGMVYAVNLRDGIARTLMRRRKSLFGLTFGAHTREAYFRLAEGWALTPPGYPTDLYMWNKFVQSPRMRCATTPRITALHFPDRKGWPPGEREKELMDYALRIEGPEFAAEAGRAQRRHVQLMRWRLGYPYIKIRYIGRKAAARRAGLPGKARNP